MDDASETPLRCFNLRSVPTNRSASIMVASRNSLSELSSLTSPISRRYKRTGSSESSAATSCDRSGRISSRSSSCCTSRDSSGSMASSNTASSVASFSSTMDSTTAPMEIVAACSFAWCIIRPLFTFGFCVVFSRAFNFVFGLLFTGIGFPFPFRLCHDHTQNQKTSRLSP